MKQKLERKNLTLQFGSRDFKFEPESVGNNIIQTLTHRTN